MASSTSLEGDLDTTVTRASTHQHRHPSRSRQRARSKQQQHPPPALAITMNSNTSAFDQKTPSAGGTSSETEEEGLDDDLNVKKNTKMNEIVFLPMPTAHLRALAAEHAARDEDEDADDDQDVDEDVLDYSEETKEGLEHSAAPGNMRMENERLRDQLKFKDKYIKQLEARVFQLEIHQHKQHNSFLHSNSPKKRNQ